MILRVKYTRVNIAKGRARRVHICRNECLAKILASIDDRVALAAALLEAVYSIENGAEALDHGLYSTTTWDGVELLCRTPCSQRPWPSGLPSMTGRFDGYVDYVLLYARPVYDRGPRLRVLARCEPRGWTILLDDGELSEVVLA